AGSLAADHYVLAAGSFSAPLARQMGLRLPVYPLKGYSATVPVTDRSRVPRLSIGDLDRKLSVSRLGDRLRAAG
ncbi:MAG: D-amino acid dehydrogenase, partial [Gammaproteobacteria bacterium]|nr:D-amino acid dehydrogenase [Gammaproteobacteria bacterium]